LRGRIFGYANTDGFSYSHADTNTDGYSNSDRHGSIESDTYTYSDASAESNSNSNNRRVTNSYAYFNSQLRTGSNGQSCAWIDI
jgi:hypothetical protein